MEAKSKVTSQPRATISEHLIQIDVNQYKDARAICDICYQTRMTCLGGRSCNACKYAGYESSKNVSDSAGRPEGTQSERIFERKTEIRPEIKLEITPEIDPDNKTQTRPDARAQIKTDITTDIESEGMNRNRSDNNPSIRPNRDQARSQTLQSVEVPSNRETWSQSDFLWHGLTHPEIDVKMAMIKAKHQIMVNLMKGVYVIFDSGITYGPRTCTSSNTAKSTSQSIASDIEPSGQGR